MAYSRQAANKRALIEAAHLLGDLNEEVVFVGGRIVGLLITDELEDDVRPTYDIDVAVNITGIVANYDLEKKLIQLGFKPEGTINCRYLHGETIIDVMHTDGKLQGLNTKWYPEGFANAVSIQLDEHTTIKTFNAVYFIAAKLEAFKDRSYTHNDYFDCKDLEDIINVINGRPQVVDEIREAASNVRAFIAKFINTLIEDPKWFDAIKMIARQERSRSIVLKALEEIRTMNS